MEQMHFPELEFSPEVDQLFTALAKAQGEIQTVDRDREVTVRTNTGPSYNYTYATLGQVREACRKPFSENGLCILQFPNCDGNTVTVITRLGHSSGQWAQCRLTLPVAQRTAQGIGSAITYARRYTWTAVIGLASEEDDDAQAADAINGKTQQRQRTTPQAGQQQGNRQQQAPAQGRQAAPESSGDRKATEQKQQAPAGSRGGAPAGDDELRQAQKAWHAQLRDHCGDLNDADRHEVTSLLVGQRVTSEKSWKANHYAHARKRLAEHVAQCPIKQAEDGLCPLVAQALGIPPAGADEDLPPPPDDVQPPANSRPAAPAEGAMACSRPDCGKPLTKGQHDVSIRAFGQPLCPACQKQQARAAA